MWRLTGPGQCEHMKYVCRRHSTNRNLRGSFTHYFLAPHYVRGDPQRCEKYDSMKNNDASEEIVITQSAAHGE